MTLAVRDLPATPRRIERLAADLCKRPSRETRAAFESMFQRHETEVRALAHRSGFVRDAVAVLERGA